MKKILIILAFIPLLGFGQVGQWSTLDGIIYDTDSTGKVPLNATDTIYLINVHSSDSGIAYINRRSGVKMIYDFDNNAIDDTIPAVCLFQNYDFDSLFYSRIEEKTINSDSTLNLPQRVTEIEVYSSATNRMSYFNVPFSLTATTLTVCASGCDYTDIPSAITAASITDTILVFSDGDYNNANTLNVNKAIYIKSIGEASIKTTGTNTYTIFLGSGANLEGFTIDGEGVNSTALYYVQTNETITSNNYITGHTSYNALIRGTSNTDVNYLYSSVFDNDNSNATIRRQQCDAVISENYFGGSASAAYEDNATANVGYLTDYTYNMIEGDYSTNYAFRIQGSDWNIKYNAFDIDSINDMDNDISGFVSYLKTFNYKGNTVNIGATSDNLGFLNSTLDNTKYTVDNNTVTITDKCIAIYFESDCTTVVRNNNISIDEGNILSGIYPDDNTKYVYVQKNEFNLLNANNDLDYTVSFIYNPQVLDFNLVIEDNLFRNSNYFNPAILGGHTCLYVGNVPNTTIKRNHFTGASIGGVILKGFTGVAAGLSTNYDVNYNIFDDVNIIVKGARNVKIYNNVFVNSVLPGIRVFRENALEDSDSAKIFNNIVFQSGSYPLFFDSQSLEGMESDNNILYGNIDTSAYIDGVSEYDFLGWQGQGYDLNSFNTNPNIKSSTEFWPTSGSDAIGNGVNLGSPYDYGLNTSSSWPDNVVLKQQVGDWDIGAYIVDKQTVVTSGLKVISSGKNIIIFNR